MALSVGGAQIKEAKAGGYRLRCLALGSGLGLVAGFGVAGAGAPGLGRGLARRGSRGGGRCRG